jgi:uncharacterized integral membrane protein
MKNLKVIAAVVVGILIVVVTLQNTQEVDTRLLFVTISMPRAVLLIVTLIIGFVIGLLVSGRLRAKKSA